MTIKKLENKRCRVCKNILISEESKVFNKCFFCRNFPEIKKRRMEAWNVFKKNADMITDPFVKRYVIMNLLKNKKKFEDTGVM